MTSATDFGPWLSALRGSHDRLADIAGSLDTGGLGKQSAASEWSIAAVLSHLGSGAEIFLLNLDAGLTGGEPPGRAEFEPIWAQWNARPPHEQASQSLVVNETLVRRLESLTAEEIAAFQVPFFGRTLDLTGMARLRLSEHAMHTWDVAVAVDPAGRVSPDTVALLIDGLGGPMMAFMGKKAADPAVIAVTTTDPARTFTLDTGGVTLTPGTGDEAASGSLELTAEALLRLVYGRLDDSALDTGEVKVTNVSLPYLQAVFPGF